MSATLYIFRLVWPFLKELLLGGLTLREGMRTQRKKVFLLFFVSSLIIALFLIIPKFYILSQEHLKLEQSVTAANVKRMEDKIKELEGSWTPLPGDSIKPVVTIEPEKEIAPLHVYPEPKKPTKATRKPPSEPSPPKAGQDIDSKRKKAYMDFFEKYND